MKKGAVPSTVLIFLLFVVVMIIIFLLILWSKGQYDLGLESFWEILNPSRGEPGFGTE